VSGADLLRRCVRLAERDDRARVDARRGTSTELGSLRCSSISGGIWHLRLLRPPPRRLTAQAFLQELIVREGDVAMMEELELMLSLGELP